jgi:hypothetical protein
VEEDLGVMNRGRVEQVVRKEVMGWLCHRRRLMRLRQRLLDDT